MGKPKPEEVIRKRLDQTVSPEELKAFGVPPQCMTCPRVAFEYREQRNKATDSTHKASDDDYYRLDEALKDLRSPMVSISTFALHELLDVYVETIETHQRSNPFQKKFADYLVDAGTLGCKGVIEFDEPQPYPRRYTRDKRGHPVAGEATAVCAQDMRYIRDSVGYADMSLAAVNIDINET